MRHSIAVFAASGILLVAASCASHKPGDPAHAWANGTWNGVDHRFDRTFQMEVVDGDRIIGTMTNCSVSSGGCGSGPLSGSVTGNEIYVTGEMRSGTYDFTLRRIEDDNLRMRRLVLKKVK